MYSLEKHEIISIQNDLILKNNAWKIVRQICVKY